MNLAQLFKPVEQIVGLEITQGFLLAALVERSPTSTITIHHKKAVLPPGIVVAGALADRQGLSSALKQFVRANKDVFRSRYVILSFPSALLYTDVIQFPPLSPEQIAESLALNLKSAALFPFAPEAVYYDWQPVRSETPAHHHALVGMARRTDVNAFIEACEQAGLEPIAFEPPQLSIARAVTNFSRSLGMVIRLLDEGVEFSVIQEGELRFGRFVRMPPILSTLDAFKTFVADETAKMLSFFHAEHPEKQISSVLVLSSFTQKTEVASFLSEQLKVTAEALATARGVELQDDYVVACGAALRGLIPREEDTFISLMPVGTEETYRSRRLRAYISLWADIINTSALLLVVLFTAAFFLLGRVGQGVSAQAARIAGAQAVQTQIRELERAATQFNQAVAEIIAVEERITRWSDILSKIAPSLREDGITINGIQGAVPGPITVSFTATTRERANAFRKTIEAAGIYERVDMPFLSLTRQEQISTTLTLVLRP